MSYNEEGREDETRPEKKTEQFAYTTIMDFLESQLLRTLFFEIAFLLMLVIFSFFDDGGQP